MSEPKDEILDAILNGTSIANIGAQSSSQEPGEQPVAEQPQAAPVDESKPAAEAPPAPSQEPAVTPTNWISEVSKSIGMEIQSVDQLKDLAKKATEYDGLESQKTILNQELEKLKAEQSVNPYANDYIKKLNDMVAQRRSKDDIKAFETINSVGELKELDPLHTVKLALQLRDGLTPEEADIRIKSRYKLDDTLYDEDVVSANKVDLKLDAKKDAEFLETFKAKVSENPVEAQQQDLQKKVQEYTARVTPIAKSIQENLTAIKGVNLNGKAGEDAFITDLPVSEETRSKISEIVTQYAVANEIELNEEGVKNLNTFAENIAAVQNWRNWMIDAASKAELRVRAEFDNPSTIERGNDNPVDQSAITAKKQEEWVLQHS